MYSSLIGTPYSEKDCWAIVVDFYKLQFNLELKNYYEEVPPNKDIAKNIIYSSSRDFEEVTSREFGDIFVITIQGVPSHIAVYIGDGKMLHTTHHSGCVIERVPRWEKLIVGTYRIKNDSIKKEPVLQ